MDAAWYEANGAARDVLRLGTMPDPEPAAGEVRVRLAASGVNPSDVKTRAGLRRPIAFPRIVPGSDGAGVIDRVGAGVDLSRIGKRVWVCNAAWGRPFGTSASFTCVPDDFAFSLPTELGFAEGACLGIPVMTAHRCLFADGPVTGLNVLVTGGAGVVGHYAIQLAKWGGACMVATTVSDAAKAEHAQQAGADLVIDYRREDVAARLEAELGPQSINRVVDVDFGANLALTSRVIAPDGVIASYASMAAETPALPFYLLAGLNVVVRPVLMYTMSDTARRAAAADIERWVGDGAAQFAIAARFPLSDIVAAHEAVEQGRKIGHVVLDVP